MGRRWLDLWILALLGGLFVWAKCQDLQLPYFWDEAWSYIPAIHAMFDNGPSLVPGAIAPELYRGHPLLFYCLYASWMHVVGSSIFAAKSLSLIISMILLGAIHQLAKKQFGRTVAFISVIFFSIQSVFFVQASFVLPEVLLALFTVCAVHAFLQEQKISTVWWLSCALFTKETAIVLFCALVIAELYRNKSSKPITRSSYLLFPLGLIGVFFAWQKAVIGWFFFPEHLAFIDVEGSLLKLESITASLFIYMGRNVLTFIGIGCLAYLLNKKSLSTTHKKALSFFGLFVVGYLIFSALNFYSPRYLLSVLPFTVIALSFFIYETFRKRHITVGTLVLLIPLVNNLYYTLNAKGDNDHTLGYYEAIANNQEAIRFCEQHGLLDEPIATVFLLRHYMSNEQAGYLSSKHPFSVIRAQPDEHTRYYLIPTSEQDEVWEKARSGSTLVRSFENGNAHIELRLRN